MFVLWLPRGNKTKFVIVASQREQNKVCDCGFPEGTKQSLVCHVFNVLSQPAVSGIELNQTFVLSGEAA